MKKTKTMATVMPIIEEMPFFDGFYAEGKAIVDTDAFEKWIREVLGNNPQYKQDQKQTVDSEKSDNITELLNCIYETESSAVDPVLMKMQAASIESGGW